jgi:hypothetical protein
MPQGEPGRENPQGISRRNFLKGFAAALTALSAAPVAVLEQAAAPAAAAAPVAAAQAVSLQSFSEAVWNISMRGGFLHTGVHHGAEGTMKEVDAIMALNHQFWKTALNEGLGSFTPEEAARYMLDDLIRKYPDTLARDPEMYKQHIEFYTHIVKQGIEYVSKSDTDLLDDLMSRASDGYKHWLKLQESSAAGRAARFPNEKFVKEDPSGVTPTKGRARRGGEPTHDLQNLLNRLDVRVLKVGDGIHIAAFDKALAANIASLVRICFPDAPIKLGPHSIHVVPAPHTLRSLARPFIKEYIHQLEKLAPTPPH